jgi:hypothetical protein
MIGNGHTTPATPEDDKQAQVILSNLEEFIYDPEVQSELVTKMGEGDPATAIGGITGQLVHMQMVVAEGTGNELSRDILIAVAAEIINALIEIAMQAGIIQATDDQQLEQLQGDALIAAVDAYMQLGDEKVNGEAASKLANDVMGGQMDSSEAQQGLVNNMGGGIPPEAQGDIPMEGGGIPPEAQGDIPMEGEGIPPEEQVPMGTQGLIGGAA